MLDFLLKSYTPAHSNLLAIGAIVLAGSFSLVWLVKTLSGGNGSVKSVLDKSEFRKFPLIKRLQLITTLPLIGLPCQMISFLSICRRDKALIDGKEIIRSYTPTSLSSDKGFFDLVVKSYPNGLLSKWFSELKLGDFAEVRGPKGNFEYKPNMCRAFGMIAGGSGLTPMLQIIRTILENDEDKTKVSLIFANVNEEDILLKEVLDELAGQHPSRFSVFYVLNNPPNGWKGGVGFVTEDMMKAHLPPPNSDIKILLCGPPPMVKAMQQNCENLGYEKARPISKIDDMVFKF